MLKFVLGLLSLVFLAKSSELQERQESYVVVDLDEAGSNIVRAYTATGIPTLATAYGLTVSGSSVQWTGDSVTGAVNVDSASFTVATPEYSTYSGQDNGLAVGFQYAGVDAYANPNTNVAAAAVVQAIARFEDIFVYLDQDSKSGFQYQPGDDLNCASNSQSDCVVEELTINLKNVTFDYLTTAQTDCSAESNALPDCKIFTITATSNGNYAGLIQVTVKIATQPILMNGIELTPDYSKIDIEINYPWDTMDPNMQYPDAKLGLSAIAGGQVLVAGGVKIKSRNNGNAAYFAASETLSAYFSWSGEAEVDQGTGSVFFSAITGQDVLDYGCTDCTLFENAFWGYLRTVVSGYRVLGWELEFVWFSWSETRPAHVYWDPAIGVDGAEGQATSSNSAALSIIFFLFSTFF